MTDIVHLKTRYCTSEERHSKVSEQCRVFRLFKVSEQCVPRLFSCFFGEQGFVKVCYRVRVRVVQLIFWGEERFDKVVNSVCQGCSVGFWGARF